MQIVRFLWCCKCLLTRVYESWILFWHASCCQERSFHAPKRSFCASTATCKTVKYVPHIHKLHLPEYTNILCFQCFWRSILQNNTAIWSFTSLRLKIWFLNIAFWNFSPGAYLACITIFFFLLFRWLQPNGLAAVHNTRILASGSTDSVHGAPDLSWGLSGVIALQDTQSSKKCSAPVWLH